MGWLGQLSPRRRKPDCLQQSPGTLSPVPCECPHHAWHRAETECPLAQRTSSQPHHWTLGEVLGVLSPCGREAFILCFIICLVSQLQPGSYPDFSLQFVCPQPPGWTTASSSLITPFHLHGYSLVQVLILSLLRVCKLSELLAESHPYCVHPLPRPPPQEIPIGCHSLLRGLGDVLTSDPGPWEPL